MDARPLIRQVSAEETRPLRHHILRPGQTYEETAYPGDDLPATVHLGAFDGDRLVGIASLYREGRDGAAIPLKGPLGPRPGWRLRGMATDDAVRGAGFGGALLAACVDHVAAAGGGELWCNARMVAVGFYQRAVFEILSDEFDVPGIGAHVVMARTVPAG